MVEHLPLAPGCDPRVLGLSPTSGSPWRAYFSLCLRLCLSVSHEFKKYILKKTQKVFSDCCVDNQLFEILVMVKGIKREVRQDAAVVALEREGGGMNQGSG